MLMLHIRFDENIILGKEIKIKNLSKAFEMNLDVTYRSVCRTREFLDRYPECAMRKAHAGYPKTTTANSWDNPRSENEGNARFLSRGRAKGTGNESGASPEIFSSTGVIANSLKSLRIPR